MFRKIVTELSYSPALAGRLGEYIRLVRQEKTKREIGLILIVLVLIVQLFATSFPPESANADNPTSFVDGGIQSMESYLTAYYDQNTAGIKDFLSSLAITRSELRAATLSTIEPSPNHLLWSTSSHGDGSDSRYTFFNTSDLRWQTDYYRSLPGAGITLPNDAHKPLVAYTGTSSVIGWFAVLKDSGNLVTRPIHQISCARSMQASTEAQNTSLACQSALKPSLSAYAISTGSPQGSLVAHPSDRIMYTLTVKNTGDTSLDAPLLIEVGDTLEYAQILDKGGGTFNADTKTLTWEPVFMPAGSELTRSFIVQLLPVIPSTAEGTYNTSSYDCVISTSFGNAFHTPVACPFPKTIEQAIHTLPSVAPMLGLGITAMTICIAAYLYIRSRQFLAELHHIQHNHSGGL